MHAFLTSLPVLLAMGAAGTLHCAGMCGGLAVLAGGRRPARLALYLAGKAAAYVLLGAVAGAAGEALLRAAPLGLGSRLLAAAAGVLLLFAGLESLGLLGAVGLERLAQVSRGLARLAGAGPAGALVMGAANGLLPCPMVYAFAAMAAISGSAIWGAATMLVLGITSAVPLVFCSAVGHRLTHFRSVAGILMLLMAALCLHRGLAPEARHGAHGLSPATPTHHHVH